MSERWARAAIQTYRWLGLTLYPFIGPYIAWRASRGKEDHSRRHERSGKASIERPAGPLVWIHAVSVGETGAVTGLIKRLRGLGLNVILTTGTTTSAALAAERFGNDIIHQYVPLDLKPAVSRFLNHWKPDIAIFAESEIWPMTILELEARRIPQILVNGRMSDRSFKRWKKRRGVADTLFENFALVAAQSQVDAERFRQLGARPVFVTGNLKADVIIPAVDDETKARIEQSIEGREVWAAISTHDGEELVAARVHRALKKKWPNLLTIIVPRHPNRCDDVRAALETQKLDIAVRSTDGMPYKSSDIFLGDTIGEMGVYLSMASIAFVGKSLKGAGGQNPLEPAVSDTAILSGPNVEAFQEAYDKLIAARGAWFVEDDLQLARSVNHLLANEQKRRHMTKAAEQVVKSMGGALDTTVQVLDPFINPLIMNAQLGNHHSQDNFDEPQTNNKGRAKIGWK